jgi:hypothetical protein
MDIVPQPLTTHECSLLSAHEAQIERGLQTFYDVGTALLAIRDQRLYRATFATFEAYCRERWGMAASRARQLISAAEVVRDVGSVTIVTLSHESQARPLAAVPPSERAEVWQEAVDTAPNGKVTAAHVQQVVDRRRELEPIRVMPEPPPLPMVEPPEPPTPHAVHYSSATPEWYTPTGVIDRVLAVLGHIDLDPCSNAHGDAANVSARFHYTKADDGLTSSWAMPHWVDDDGCESAAVKVYMNPPYGTEIGPWIERLCNAYETGEITEAIALVPARVDTAWFQPLFAYALCFVRGRLKFVGAEDSAPFPSVVVYLGPDAWLFRDVFGSIGRVGVLT